MKLSLLRSYHGFALSLWLLLTATAPALDIKISPGRASHSFGFAPIDHPESMVGGSTGGLIAGTGSAEGWLLYSYGWDPQQPLLLLDFTTGEWLTLDPQGYTVLDVRATAFSNSWDSGYYQYFLIPEARTGHPLMLSNQTSGTPVYYVATLSGTNSLIIEDATYREMRAQFPPGSSFFLVDLETAERSQSNWTWLGPDVWTAYTGATPLVSAVFYLSAEQTWQSFTLHVRPSGGSEFLQQVTASGPTGGGYSQDADWSGFTIAEDASVINVAVGYGMEVWLTRDSDGAQGPHVWHSNQGFPNHAPAVWNWQDTLLEPPPPELPWVNFRLPATGYNYVVHLWDDDSMVPISITSTGWLTSYDDYGVVNATIEYALGTAQFDSSRPWSVSINENGTFVNGWDQYRSDLLDWYPTHETPPSITPDSRWVLLPAFRFNNNNMTLNQATWSFNFYLNTTNSTAPMWNDYVNVEVPWGNAQSFTEQTFDSTGLLYELNYIGMYLPINPAQSFSITDSDYGDTSPNNVDDLRHWFPPPAEKQLGISSSRWGHDLWLLHPNGDSWPIAQHATQGDFSLTNTGAAWWNSYYWFDATVPWRYFLPWQLEDRDTNERTPLVQPWTGDTPNFIDWIALPSPADLTGTLAGADGIVDLQWPLGTASPDGGFEIERQVGNGAWTQISTLAASERDENNVLHYSDGQLTVGSMHRYRVRFAYGGRHSAPSTPVALNGWLDSDGDGLPDAWELAMGLNPNNAADAGSRMRGLGATATSLFQNHDNPTNASAFDPVKWTTTPRFNLYQENAYNVNGQWIGYDLTWDGPVDEVGTVTIQTEKWEGAWIDSVTVPASAKHAYIPGRPVTDAVYMQNAHTGRGPAFNEEFNHRIRGGATSNESVMKVRLMMRTSEVNRSQPGYRELGGDWSTPANGPAKYYKDATWTESFAQGDALESNWYTSSGLSNIHPGTLSAYSWEDTYYGFDGADLFGNGYHETGWRYKSGGENTPRYGTSSAHFYGDSMDTSSTNHWYWDDTTADSSYMYYDWGSISHAPIHFTDTDANGWRLESWNAFDLNDPTVLSGWFSLTTWTPGDTTPDGGDEGAAVGSFPFPWGEIIGPTSIFSETEDEDGTWSLTVDLSNEYTQAQFFADSLLLLPPFPTTRSVNHGSDLAKGGCSTLAKFDQFPQREEGFQYSILDPMLPTIVTSHRFWRDATGSSALLKSEWWLECNDCLPAATVNLIEYAQEYAPVGFPVIGTPKGVNAVTIAPGSKPGEAIATTTQTSDLTTSSTNVELYFTGMSQQMIVDADRDGQMSFNTASAEQTTAQTPYRFWVNNDSDGILDGEEVAGGSPDYADVYLKSMRDLEDFSRLWINFKGITEMVKSASVTVKLEWKPMDSGTNWPSDAGTPAINIFKAVEADGGNKYLSDEATAKNQVSYGNLPGEYSISLGRVGRGQSLVLPASLFSSLSESQPNKFLIFEGAGEGKGQLVLTVHKGGRKIAEYPPVYLNLKDVKKMYDRGQANTNTTVPNNSTSTFTVTSNPDPLPGADQQLIVFVHGINNTDADYLNSSNTMFKRLFWQGFKGHFASFRWPSPLFSSIPVEFNTGEYVAFKSGAALKGYLNYLHTNSRLAGYTINVAAHSQGNIVAGEALREGAQIANYALMEAAVSAKAYDGDNAALDYYYLTAQEGTHPTPDQDVLGGYKNCFTDQTRRVNFYNEFDYALVGGPSNLHAWEGNQHDYKPDSFWLNNGPRYSFDGQDCYATFLFSVGYIVHDEHEKKAFVARSRSKAVGGQGTTRSAVLTGGSISQNVNLRDEAVGFTGNCKFGDTRPEHSGAFTKPIQYAVPFYKSLLSEGFQIQPIP